VPPLNIKSTEQTHIDYELSKKGEEIPAYYLNVLEELADVEEWCISE
jgi:hypothetical protein